MAAFIFLCVDRARRKRCYNYRILQDGRICSSGVWIPDFLKLKNCLITVSLVTLVSISNSGLIPVGKDRTLYLFIPFFSTK